MQYKGRWYKAAGIFYFGNMVLIITALLCLLSLSQCKTGKAITKAIAPIDTINVLQIKSKSDSIALVNTTLEILDKASIDYKTFSAKIKLDIETTNGKKPDLVANIRMIKDSAVWISISASLFSVEVFRALITKDSVILINKQEKQVYYRSIDYLQELTEIPFNLKTIQNLLIGNPVFFNAEKVTVKKLENQLIIASAGGDFKNLLTLITPQNWLQQIKLADVDVLQNRTAEFTYDDYKKVNEIFFAEKRQIIVSEKNKLDISMNFKQYEFNKELSVTFSVPKNYKKN